MYWNSVSPLLRSLLKALIDDVAFNSFRLVGGTALALQLGHRVAGDISLSTGITYENLYLDGLGFHLKRKYAYYSRMRSDTTFKGIQFFIGDNENEAVKVELSGEAHFVDFYHVTESIRLATIEDIIAMKIEAMQTAGRKEDFWDLHELLRTYSLESMMGLHKKRYPNAHDKALILEKLTDFTRADEDFEPICLRGKYWGLIKLDIIQAASEC